MNKHEERLGLARGLLLTAAPSPYLTAERAEIWRQSRRRFLTPTAPDFSAQCAPQVDADLDQRADVAVLRALPAITDLLAKLDNFLSVREEDAVGGYLPMDDADESDSIPIGILRDARRLLEVIRADVHAQSRADGWDLARELRRLLKTAAPGPSMSALHAAKWRRERNKLLGLGEPEVER